MVKTAMLAGGLEYSDGYFVDNDARFTFGFVRKALDAEATRNDQRYRWVRRPSTIGRFGKVSQS